MTEPNRIRDMQEYEAGEGSEAPEYQTLAPRVLTRRVETRWEFGIFFRIFRNGRLVANLSLGKGGRPPEPRLLQRAVAAPAPDAGDSLDEPGVDAQGDPAPIGGDGGPIEETRTEVGIFMGKVTTETTTDGSSD